MSRAPRLAAALCAVALLAAACGDDDDDTGTADTAATTAGTERAETTSAATSAPATSTPATSTPVTTAPATTEPAATTAPTIGSIVDVAAEAGTFTTLLAAADAAGLTEELATRELTLLAPTDDAFAALGQETVDALLADPVALVALLRNHMLPVPQTSDSIGLFSNVLTVDGVSHDVVVDGDTITIGGAHVVTADIPADNGVVHAIDAVLVPAPPAG